MELKVKETKLPGFYEINPSVYKDNRGNFVKIFRESVFKKHAFDTNFVEEYYTTSFQGVLRGLHFQLPPYDHAKLICCLSGKIFDVVVDLRVGSPTYGKYETVVFSSNDNKLLYIPRGLAHGFYTMSKETILLYKVTAEYSPVHDSGILWNSLSIPWPVDKPILSERDSRFGSFSNFKSPFTYR